MLNTNGIIKLSGHSHQFRLVISAFHFLWILFWRVKSVEKLNIQLKAYTKVNDILALDSLFKFIDSSCESDIYIWSLGINCTFIVPII